MGARELAAYTRLVSTVPPRPYTMLLVRVFLEEVNWVYGMMHGASLVRAVDAWYTSCAGPDPPAPGHTRAAAKRELAQLPALLLQVVALALQALPHEHYHQIAQLSVLGGADFGAMAAAHSESACELAQLLAKHPATLPRVQMWFLRASFLKNDGRSIESWHALGHGIREAQEIGLHKEPPPSSDTAVLWRREIERRAWANFYIWDR